MVTDNLNRFDTSKRRSLELLERGCPKYIAMHLAECMFLYQDAGDKQFYNSKGYLITAEQKEKYLPDAVTYKSVSTQFSFKGTRGKSIFEIIGDKAGLTDQP